MGLKIRNKMLTVTPISISVSQRVKRIKTKVRKTEKKRKVMKTQIPMNFGGPINFLQFVFPILLRLPASSSSFQITPHP